MMLSFNLFFFAKRTIYTILLEKYAEWRFKKAIKLKLLEAEAKQKDLVNQPPDLFDSDLPDIEN